MYCKNCGNEVAEGVRFCSKCGANLEISVDPEQNTFENQEQNTFVNQEQNGEVCANQEQNGEDSVNQPLYNADANDFVAVNEETFVAPTKTKGKFAKKLLCIVVPVIAVMVVVALCFNSITGFFMKNFGSNSDYFAYVEGTTLSGYSDSFTSLYSKNQSGFSNGIGTQNELKVELGDSLKTMLSGYLNGMDLSWLNQIKLVGDTSFKDNKTSGTFGIVLGEQTILTFELIVDATTNAVLMRCKELNDKYISLPVESSINSTESFSALTMLFTSTKYLPSEEELNDLLKKYITIILKEITDDDVTKESGEVTANGVSEKCTVLKLKVTEKLALNVIKAILTEAATDQDIIAILEKFENGIKEASDIEIKGDAVEEYKEGIADALENIAETLETLNGNGSEYFVLTDYVNSSHNIIGREVSVNGLPVFSAISATEGTNLGFELTVSDQLSIVGAGENNGNSISGDYVVAFEGKELLNVSLDNIALDLENSNSKGAIEIKLGKDVSSLMDSSSYAAISLVNPSIRIEVDASADKSIASIALLSGENNLVKVSLDSSIANAQTIETPAADAIMSSTEINPSDFDFSKIIENLKKAGVPQNILAMLQYAVLAG